MPCGGAGCAPSLPQKIRKPVDLRGASCYNTCGSAGGVYFSVRQLEKSNSRSVINSGVCAPMQEVIIMIQTTLNIDGMMCGMCESHINDAVRRDFPIKKVTSSHGKGTCVILSEEPLDEGKLRETIDATGYTLVSVQSQPYEKKGGLGGLFHRK